MWLSQAKIDAKTHRSMRYQLGRGTCVLFILDFSESMRGSGIQSLRKGVSEILDEFSKHPELEENVAVLVFGEETKFLHHYSNHYAAIKETIEQREPCGPSPLTAAFLLSVGGIFHGSSHIQTVGDFLLPPRVVLFTDGRLTDFLKEGAKEDEAEQHLSHSILRSLFSITSDIGRDHPIFCFPVGDNPNYELLHKISMQSMGGKVLDIKKARWFGKYTLHYRGANIVYRITNQTTVEREVLRTIVVSVMSLDTYEEDDLDTIHELLGQRTNIIATQERIIEDPADEYHKEKYATVPKLGTRVRRGPHWTFKNQDSEGAGTVVGHRDLAGTVNVEWDSGLRFPYSHGCGGIYDVVVCDEPRIPDDGFAAVGCLVKRGPDWKWDDQDGGVGSIGTVYRVKDDATVYIRWSSGRNSNYRFGYEGKFDIEVCDPFSPEVIQAVREQQKGAQCFNIDEKRCNDLKGMFNKDGTTKSEYETKEVTVSTKDSQVSSESKKQETFKTHSPDTAFLDKSGDERHILSDEIQKSNFTVTYDNDIQTDSVCEQPRACIAMRYPNYWTSDSRTDCKTEHENIKAFKNAESFDVPNEFNNVFLEESFFGSKLSDGIETSYPQNHNLDAVYDCFHGAMEENILNKNLQNVHHSEKITDDLNCRWQWLSCNGVWVEYPDYVNSQINHSLHKRPNASVVIHYREQSFRIVASKSIQINIESKERTKIRCKNSE
nr:uncharacterized protein LOC105331856 [Crassostrea gigas]